MSSNLRDYSVFDKFDFERKPVGVKFVITKPEGIERLGKELNICEMLKEAQVGNPVPSVRRSENLLHLHRKGFHLVVIIDKHKILV